jgi:MFS family permease
MFCFGESLVVYIIARFLQGISSAVVWIVGYCPLSMIFMAGLALIADTVGEKKMGVAMAWVSIQLNVGLMMGPLLGGIVYDKVGWFGTFSLGFGVLGLDIILRLIIIEKRIARRYENAKYSDEILESVVYRHRIPEVIRLLRYPRMIAGMWLALCQATIISAFDAFFTTSSQ